MTITFNIDPLDPLVVAFTVLFALLTWKSGYLQLMLDSARLNPWFGPKTFHFSMGGETPQIATDETRLK